MKHRDKKQHRASSVSVNQRRRAIWLRRAGNQQKTQARSHTAAAELIQAVEGILFIARDPLTTAKLVQYARLRDGKEAHQYITQLNQRYDQGGHAFRIEEIAGGFQLRSRPTFSRWLKRLEHIPSPLRLSAPSIETLSVIAYRQPVLRAEVEAIRGVGCGEVIRQLMERELVRVAGRSHELGRPYLYATTKKFLGIFGLSSLKSLPPLQPFLHALPTSDDDGVSTKPAYALITTEYLVESVVPGEGEHSADPAEPDGQDKQAA